MDIIIWNRVHLNENVLLKEPIHYFVNTIGVQMNKQMPEFSEKKLLVISPGYPDQYGNSAIACFVRDQVNAIKRYFNEIIVISPILSTFGMTAQDKFCHDYQHDNVKVYFPRCFFIPRRLNLPISFNNRYGIDNRLNIVCNLIKENKIQYDIIHAHFTLPSGHIGSALKQMTNKPLIVTIHENGWWFQEELNSNNSKIHDTWKNADILLRVNNHEVEYLKKFNPNSFSIKNGYDKRFFPLNKEACKKRLQLPENKKIIFSLGQLIERKGFHYLIDAMRIITSQRDDIACYIGGSGELRKKLEKKIQEYNLESCVHLCGFICDDNIPLWMNACDVFVLPSLSESFGIVQIEAMACGTPVVATINGGSEEIVISNEFGFLCNTEDSKCLAEYIINTLEKEWDHERIVQYAQIFSWENCAKDLLAIYVTGLNGS